MNAVNIIDLKKSYGSNLVLDGVSMHIKEGEIYGLLGPNGAGKSTLMRIILGLMSYDDGKIEIFGLERKIAAKKLSRQINALPEFFELYGWMQSIEYLQLFADLYGVNCNETRIRKLLAEVGLDPFERKAVGDYSQGMKKRLGLARALINDPKLLILDEPTNGLDPNGRREIHDLLLDLNRKNGTTIILSTHILDDVERLCSRIGILYNGKLRYEGMLLQNEKKQRYRYRFEVADATFEPTSCTTDHIRFIRQEDRWVECEIDGIAPYKAIQSLLEHDIPISQAISLAGSLEYLYFSVTQEEKMEKIS
jgi:ABC-2 type transport system ATP-binding protein